MHQPNYLPYLGFFHKVAQAELFVSYDIAQFSRHDFHNRNEVKAPHGRAWITVPVKKPRKRQLREIEIENSMRWPLHHLLTLKNCYSKAPYFEDYFPYFERVYSMSWEKLVHLTEEILRHFFGILCPHVEFRRASELEVPNHLDATERIIWIVRSFGGSTFISGSFGKRYLNETKFVDLKLKYQKFQHPTYRQLFGDFIPNLSFIDYLFNMGEDNMRNLLSGT